MVAALPAETVKVGAVMVEEVWAVVQKEAVVETGLSMRNSRVAHNQLRRGHR